jgi:hypothetical protein
MKMDQVAYYAHNEIQVDAIKRSLGLLDAEWIEDIASGDVSLADGTVGVSTGHLRFCYALGMEVEILSYLKGPHWHMDKPAFRDGLPFLSHIGVHMDKDDVAPPNANLQVMKTFSHTNPYLLERLRTYKYVIQKTSTFLGCDMKYIWRLEKGEAV